MTAHSADLQKALWTALAGDAALGALLGGPKVFDGPPAGTPFPYVALGRFSTLDWSTASEGGEEALFSLHVWSRGRGRAQAQAIGAQARAIVEALGGTMGASRLVSLRFLGADWQALEAGAVQRGSLRFRAVLEAL
ncbi:MAG: DUF3168 domain-containing protein [Mesorhizobium amorphae]|nr:MAG: DUF3168 domain-containing protein [Mesorhizobium amorphae]